MKQEKIAPEPLHLLLFAVGGASFAVDADQVAEITAYHGQHDADLLWLHQIIGYDDREVTYQSPTILTIRSGSHRTQRVIIDSMEEIVEFQQDDLCLFPATVEPLLLKKGMWGVLMRHDGMTFLLDFQILLQGHT